MIGRDHLTIQAATLLKLARITSNPVAAANLNAKAAELQAKADADFPREPGPKLPSFERPSPS
jgi:hypothetical protein